MNRTELMVFALLVCGCDLPSLPADRDETSSGGQGGASATTTSASSTSSTSSAAGGGQGGSPPCQNLPCSCDDGKVGVQCSPEEPCQQCECPTGFADCNGNGCKTNLNEDPKHCGDCTHPCLGAAPTFCSGGECQCVDGNTYCDLPQVGCFDTQSDSNHCGGCGQVCPPGLPCLNGSCQCPAGLEYCAPWGCVDITSHPHACGGCGFECEPAFGPQLCSWSCVNSACVGSDACLAYGPTMKLCGGGCFGGYCTNIQTDVGNCGDCGNVCVSTHGSGASCAGSQCKLTCDAGWGNCNASVANDGCETALVSDSFHCGACGHGCQGGSCSNGVCQAFTLALGQSSPTAIAADASYLTWANAGTGAFDGTIARVAKILGGAPTVLASGRVSPTAILIQGSDVYWLERGQSAQANGGVYKVPLAGGAVATLASSQAYPLAIATDGANLYWTANEANQLVVAPSGGGAAQVLATLEGPRRITLDASYAYVTGADGALSRVALAGGSVDTLASGLSDPWGIAVDATQVYVRLGAAGAILAIPKAGGAPITLVANLDSTPDLTLDGSNLLYGSNGLLTSLPTAAGSPQALAVAAAGAVLADTAAWFWVEPGSGVVRGLAR